MNMTKIIQKKHLMHRFLGLLLVAALIGISPGIFDNIAYSPFPLAKAHAQGTSKGIFSVQTSDDPGSQAVSGSATINEASLGAINEEELANAKTLEAEEAAIDKEMSKIEEIAWSIGKAMLPTLAVMALSAALVCPLGWVVLGSVVAGALTAGIITFAYEKRKNYFRGTEKKKVDSEIWKEVSISAAISGAMAPFNMLTGGMLQTIGPHTAKTIITTAVKAGAVNLAGSTVSNTVKGGVTNLWYNNYYNYDEKEAELNAGIKALYNKDNLTSAEEAELVLMLEELDTITKKKYTMDNFIQDEKSALTSAAISGFLGGVAGRLGADTKVAKTVSSKLFGTTSKANLISNAVISNPFAFASGAASAKLKKESILKKIKNDRLDQLNYEEGSNAWNYYEEKIAKLENEYNGIKISEAGKSAMISNAATQVAMVGVSLGKTRLIDLPSEKKKKIQSVYEKDDPEWEKANYLRYQLEVKKAMKPKLDDYDSKSEYSQALANYNRELTELKEDYSASKVHAAIYQNSDENIEKISEIKKDVEAEIEFNRQSQLARSLGRGPYEEFKVKEVASREENVGLSPAQIRRLAQDEVTEGFFTASDKSAIKLQKMSEKLDTQTSELFGSIEEGDNGKLCVVVRDDFGTIVKQTEYKYGSGASLKDKMFAATTEDLKNAEVAAVVRQVYSSSSMVKPSAYRNEYVNMKVYELRGQGLSEKDIDSKLAGIVKEANGETFREFGNSWENIAKSEILAAGLEDAKYDDGAAPGIDNVFAFLKKTLSSKTVSTVQSEFSRGVKSAIDVTGIPEADSFLAPVIDSDRRNKETLEKVYRDVDKQYNSQRFPGSWQ